MCRGACKAGEGFQGGGLKLTITESVSECWACLLGVGVSGGGLKLMVRFGSECEEATGERPV